MILLRGPYSTGLVVRLVALLFFLINITISRMFSKWSATCARVNQYHLVEVNAVVFNFLPTIFTPCFSLKNVGNKAQIDEI